MNTQRWLMLGCASVLAGSLALESQADAGGGKKPAKATPAKAAEEAPAKTKKGKAVEGPEGLRFSLTTESVAKLYDKVFEADFLPRYRKTEPGPAMAALDQELADRKSELRKVLEFNDTPVALENTPLKDEFTYENGESMNHVVLTRTLMNDDLQAERDVDYHRYFFYFNDKLWKIYDEYKVGKKGLATGFEQGVQQLSKQYGKAQMLKADADAWRDYAAAQWTAGDVVVQLLDRHEEGRLAVLYMQKSTLDNLKQLRSHKPEVETVSSEVSAATSKSSSSKPKNNDSSPADAYTRKRKAQSSDE
jgi:hypothetical protein